MLPHTTTIAQSQHPSMMMTSSIGEWNGLEEANQSITIIIYLQFHYGYQHVVDDELTIVTWSSCKSCQLFGMSQAKFSPWSAFLCVGLHVRL